VPYRFAPPLSSPLVHGLVNILAPLILRLRDQIVAVEFTGLERCLNLLLTEALATETPFTYD
jgi:hypothetical protein